MKNPHFAGRKFPSPGEVVVYSFSRWVEDGNRLVKRRWALVETNPPRNSWLQTRQDDENRSEAGNSFAPGFEDHIGLTDLPMPQKTHNDYFCLPRLVGATAEACSC